MDQTLFAVLSLERYDNENTDKLINVAMYTNLGFILLIY